MFQYFQYVMSYNVYDKNISVCVTSTFLCHFLCEMKTYFKIKQSLNRLNAFKWHIPRKYIEWFGSLNRYHLFLFSILFSSCMNENGPNTWLWLIECIFRKHLILVLCLCFSCSHLVPYSITQNIRNNCQKLR